MKLPLSWLSEFIEFPKKFELASVTAAFVKLGFEVEEVINPAAQIVGPIQVGTVLEIEELTGHKKPIRFVTLDLGVKPPRQVVCGATNFKVSDQVVVALPGAVLPGGFEIAARTTYGRLSDGMICSARELGLGDDHQGIIVLSEKVKNGTDALVALGMNDPIIDIAVNPDRGYAMSIRGAARELAMALDLTFNDIDGKALIAKLERKKRSGRAVAALIEDASGADLICLRTLEQLKPTAITPEWMKRRLQQCGMRSISLAVDITNYVMLELGQPLHAFDAEKIEGKLRVQRAQKFRKIRTLDGQERKLDRDDLLIADDKRPLALAGTMGGADSEVDEKTTRIALEAAHFSALAIARNSRRHILSSEASRRFERGVDPNLAAIASARAALLLIEHGAAIYIGSSTKGSPKAMKALALDPSGISRLIGTQYSNVEIERALVAVGCKVSKGAKNWRVTPPPWRSDLVHISDFTEEVARYYGYERIPSRLPMVKPRLGASSGLSSLQIRRRGISTALANRGFTEVHNYPFVNQSQMELFGFTGDRAKAFRIANPISDQYPLLRTHLSPALLETAVRNIARGEKSVALFESGLVFRDIKALKKAAVVSTTNRPSAAQIKTIYESVPFQSLHVGGVIAGESRRSGWWGEGELADWSDGVSLIHELLTGMNLDYSVASVELAPWHPGRCAEFTIASRAVAHAGEIHPRISAALGLPVRTVFFAIALDALPNSEPVVAKPVISMPAALQDISLFVSADLSAADVEAALREGAGELLERVELFDRYQKAGEDKVSLAFTLTFRAIDRTLTTEEVSTLRAAAGAAVVAKYGAIIRS